MTDRSFQKFNKKKFFSAVRNVITLVFLVLCIFSVLVTILSKKDIDGTAEIFGYQFRVVTSESMAKSEFTDTSNFKIKSIPVRSLVFIETIPDDDAQAKEWYADLRVGDVLTFRYVYDTQVTITHRITSIRDNGEGGYIIELEGDNKNAPSGQLTQTLDTSLDDGPNHAIGKVTGKSYILGLFISLLNTKLGIILILMVPCLIIISVEVARIVKVLTEDRKKRELERDNEIASLRLQIEELKKQNEASLGETKKEGDTNE